MGIGQGRRQPMQMIPFMHIKAPQAIITSRGGVTVPRAARCTHRVAPSQPSHAARSLPRQPGPAAGPPCRGGVGKGSSSVALGQGAGTPPSPLPLRCRSPRRLPRPPAPPAPARRPPLATGVPQYYVPFSKYGAIPGDHPYWQLSMSPATAPERQDASVASSGTGSVTVMPATPGPAGHLPAVPARPAEPPGMRLPYDPNGREWRKPPRPAGLVAAARVGGGDAAPPGPVPGSDLASSLIGSPAVVPVESRLTLGQDALALPPRPVAPAVREWLALLGAAVATAH